MVIRPPLMTLFQGFPAAAGRSSEVIRAMSPVALSPAPETLVRSPASKNTMTVFARGLMTAQVVDPEAGTPIQLSPPAVAALIAGAVFLTFLVWWVTDRLGQRDFIRMHEFHKSSREFQKAAHEAILALRHDYHRVRPLWVEMNYHLGSMTELRRKLETIHRFRLDTGGDDPRILRELDQEIEEARHLIEAVSEAHDRQLTSLPTDQHGRVIRLADRPKNPRNGA